MDFLTSEINKLKRKAQPAAQSSGDAGGGDKYIRRSDLEAQRQAAYAQQQAARRAEREAKEEEKLRRLVVYESTKREKSASRAAAAAMASRFQSNDGDNTVPAGADDNGAGGLGHGGEETTAVEAMRQQLRSFGEPIRLFGEDTDDLRRRHARAVARQARLANSTSVVLRRVYDEPADEALPERPRDVLIDKTWIKSKEEDRVKLHRHLFLLFRLYMKAWRENIERDQQRRQQQQQQESKGRRGNSAPGAEEGDGEEIQAAALYAQAREHIARLLLRLETANLPSDILTNLSDVALGLQGGDYTAANHAYLQMSIGKATWPVGVTMVGIHERAQRERLHKELDSAHILADETTRQWLQSLKRLITYLEKTSVDR